MKIVVATPLYPPEIAEPAPYSKELASRLAKSHDVTVVTYSHMPEKVLGVAIVAVEKRQPLLIRLTRYFFALYQAAKNADVVFLQNGPSVELPAALVALLTRTPVILRIGDTAAHAYAGNHLVPHIIERIAVSHAQHVIMDSPLPKPEINPLKHAPEAALQEYEASWGAHIAMLEKLFHDSAN